MARDRAERRALAEKALARVKRDLVHGVLHGRPEAARWFVKARKRCSCWMCGNPRRYSSGVARITVQERKANEFASHIE
jgi:hypothetical protein